MNPASGRPSEARPSTNKSPGRRGAASHGDDATNAPGGRDSALRDATNAPGGRDSALRDATNAPGGRDSALRDATNAPGGRDSALRDATNAPGGRDAVDPRWPFRAIVAHTSGALLLALLLLVPSRLLAQTPPDSGPPSAASSSPPPSDAPPGELPRYFADGVYIDGDCPRAHPRCIALTFDDGPAAPLTSRLLDILDARHLHATFFVEGQHLDPSNPSNGPNRDVLREARRRGHFIGNHTYDHRVLDHLNAEQLGFEIDRTSRLIADVLGERPGFFRAPYGILGNRLDIGAVSGRGYTIVRWRLDPRDWAEHRAEDVLRNFRYQLHIHPNGGILLMHDVHPSTIDAVPLVLDEIERQNRVLHARGEPPFEFVTLDAFYIPRHHHHAR